MNSKPTNKPPEGMTPDNIEGHLNSFRDGYNAAMPPTVNPLPSIDEAGVIAIRISDKVNPELTAQEEALFVAGFQECVKYLGQSTPPPQPLQDELNLLKETVNNQHALILSAEKRGYEKAKQETQTLGTEVLKNSVKEYLKQCGSVNRPDLVEIDFTNGFKAGYAASEGEEAIGFAEWASTNYETTMKDCWIAKDGLYKQLTTSELYNLYRKTLAKSGTI